MDFIRRCKQNKVALLVKLADIDDNSDSLRANNPSEKEYERLKKYSKEKDELLS
ncbi:hypothetical protein [Aneurinibacillus tyrosinisolvens]|uniref:hypothetical protein n=1 Tax=Aneurinibacillus tyrosinisolvens TaxID=1443435 RepID=UPI000B1E2515|nr:hypothetical protein [Aneurinibacillus tyrosinisolvens]